MTKWNELTKWLSKHPTFNWSEMNKALGHKPSSLNSHTTYLNTLRRAGLVLKTARGEYKVLDAKNFTQVSRREALMYIELEQASDIIREKKGRINMLEKTITNMCEEQTQKQYKYDELERGNMLLRDRIMILEGRSQQDKTLIVNQLERLNAYNEKIAKMENSFFGRLARVFKR